MQTDLDKLETTPTSMALGSSSCFMNEHIFI